MFDRIARSWEYTKISYGIIWDFKSLLVFPIISGFALLLVMASFLMPLLGMGVLSQWQAAGRQGVAQDPVFWIVTFLFYFCNYFVIVFFNSALISCAMSVMRGEVPTVAGGLSMAAKRLPQILAWSLVSAAVGVVLKVIERQEKIGAIVSAILGTGWAILTYFAVPVLVMEGVGPVEAIKRSFATMKATWGESLMGHFSMGFLNVLLFLPILAVIILLGILCAQSPTGLIAVGVLAALLIGIYAAVTSAADTIFRALLYSYASGRVMPANIDPDVFAHAFGPRGE
jgi:hypothetical protein